MSLRQPGRILKWAFRAPNYLYERHLGWLLTRRVCQITHVGRTSGRTYHTVLEVVRRDPATGAVIVASGFGRTADWYRNVTASNAAELSVGRQHFPARVRELDVDEAAEVIADYERRNRFIAPIVRRGFSTLLGWRYDSSDAARCRLAGQLPLLVFSPAAAHVPPPRGPTPPVAG